VGFLRETVVFAAVVAIIYIPWMLLVYAALRACGVPVRLLPCKGRGFPQEVTLRKLGERKFVLIEGVFLWGLPCFVTLTVFDYVTHKYFGAPHHSLSPASLIAGLLIWSALGYCFGLKTWSKSSRWDFELDS
jgi:hypothetical protein